jgi:hypothetical protein
MTKVGSWAKSFCSRSLTRLTCPWTCIVYVLYSIYIYTYIYIYIICIDHIYIYMAYIIGDRGGTCPGPVTWFWTRLGSSLRRSVFGTTPTECKHHHSHSVGETVTTPHETRMLGPLVSLHQLEMTRSSDGARTMKPAIVSMCQPKAGYILVYIYIYIT